jgi:hypothetical protein
MAMCSIPETLVDTNVIKRSGYRILNSTRSNRIFTLQINDRREISGFVISSLTLPGGRGPLVGEVNQHAWSTTSPFVK